MDAADETWVAITDFVWGGGEAEAAAALLRSESIPCYLKNDDVLRHLEWPLRDTTYGNLTLMVPASFAHQAREILNSRVSEAELEAQAEKSESE